MTKIPTSDFGDPLPPEVEEQVIREIESDETIAWVGRPRRGRFFLAMLPYFLLGIPLTSLAIFWVELASQFPGPGGSGIILGLAFIAIGCGMLASPFWARRRAALVAYVVTDRTVIFFEPTFPTGQKVVSLLPRQIALLDALERGDGSGDLTFGNPLATQAGGSPYGVPRRFVGVPQIREVESLIRRTLLAKGGATP